MTTENNKIIAEFMGGKIDDTFIYFDKTNNKFEDDTLHVSDLLFDSDWNWLIEVVEKCYKTNANYQLHKNIEDSFIYMVENRIEAVYNACVEFIKWYNESVANLENK